MTKDTASEKIWLCTEDEYHFLERESLGVCLACGNTQDGCEPDARKHKCEACGEKKVYGAEEAVVMGRLRITDSERKDIPVEKRIQT